MAKYTNRTCHSCGIRKPQPEMVSKEIYAEVGKSTAGVSGATFVGSMMGDKKSSRSISSWLFNSGQRTYKRKRNVWVCQDCNKGSNIGAKAEIFFISAFLLITIIAAAAFFGYVLLVLE